MRVHAVHLCRLGALLFSAALVSKSNVPHEVIPEPPPPVARFAPPRPPPPTTVEVRNYVARAAARRGVNPETARFIVYHESRYGVAMRGDHGRSRGFWMISGIYHPEVSDACADDLACSTDWSLNQILAGRADLWSVWRFRCDWFQNAPRCESSNHN